MFLIYRSLFGLREVEHIPTIHSPGVYLRSENNTWYTSVRDGNKTKWRSTIKEYLPKKLLLEALLLNIQI